VQSYDNRARMAKCLDVILIFIIKVSPPFSFGNSVQPIALPSQGDEPAVGAVATVIGWGRTSVKKYANL
jgi:Trypsin